MYKNGIRRRQGTIILLNYMSPECLPAAAPTASKKLCSGGSQKRILIMRSGINSCTFSAPTCFACVARSAGACTFVIKSFLDERTFCVLRSDDTQLFPGKTFLFLPRMANSGINADTYPRCALKTSIKLCT